MQEPFSRVLRGGALPREGQTVTIEASPAEREALATLYNLPSIEALVATLVLKPTARDGVRVRGAVHGELTQVCVVSLEPFPATIDEALDVRFASRFGDESARRRAEEPETLSMAEDEPDPIVDGKIDLGALAAEFFALGIDPYPRKPGAEFEPPAEPETEATPFAVLRGEPKKA